MLSQFKIDVAGRAVGSGAKAAGRTQSQASEIMSFQCESVEAGTSGVSVSVGEADDRALLSLFGRHRSKRQPLRCVCVLVSCAWADCGVVAEADKNLAARGALSALGKEGDEEAVFQCRPNEVRILIKERRVGAHPPNKLPLLDLVEFELDPMSSSGLLHQSV